MKKLFKIFIILISFVLSLTNVHAATNPYNQSGPYGTNCTWYVWNKVYEKDNIALPGWGNAKNWYQDAQNSGYTVGSSPRANSIVVWGSWTEYGHVGYVEQVEGNTLKVWDSTGPCIDDNDEEYKQCIENGVSEETDKICYANAKKGACSYTLDYSYVTGYIYLDYAPTQVTTNNHNQEPAPTTTTEPEVTVSSNNNLSSIELSTGTIDFNKETLEYNLEVENTITKITVNATAEDEKSSIEGVGEHNLEVGLNTIVLKVTAEDKTTKDYTINITRKEQPQVLTTSKKKTSPSKSFSWISVIVIVALIIILSLLLIVIKNFKFQKKSNLSNKSQDKKDYHDKNLENK